MLSAGRLGLRLRRCARLRRCGCVAMNVQAMSPAVQHSHSLPDFIFPHVKDSFQLSRDRYADSATIIHLLSGQIAPERLQRMDEVLERRTYGVVPVVEELYDMGNLAALCRSADAFGFGSVQAIIPSGSKYKQSGRTGGGSEKWLDVHVWDAAHSAVAGLKQAGYQVIATHLGSGSVSMQDIDFTRPTAFVLGNERRGVSDAVVELADATAVIPMHGFVESFNISVAAGLIMYEASRQRVAKQGSPQGDLTPEQKQLLKAVWLLRSVRHSKTIVQQLLDRPPPQHQQRAFRRRLAEELAAQAQLAEASEALLGRLGVGGPGDGGADGARAGAASGQGEPGAGGAASGQGEPGAGGAASTA